MKGLHPEARALIEAAKQGEAGPSPEALARVHRAIAESATALAGAATVTSSAVATAKAAAGVSLSAKLIVAGVAGAALSAGLIMVQPTPSAPAGRPALEARSAATAPPRSGAETGLAVPEPPHVQQLALAERPDAGGSMHVSGGPGDQHVAAHSAGMPAGAARARADQRNVAAGPRAGEATNASLRPAARRAAARDESTRSPETAGGSEPQQAAATPLVARETAPQGAEARTDSAPAAAQEAPAGTTDMAPRAAAQPAAQGALPRARAAQPSRANSGLLAELTLLERVHTALQLGQAERALELLQRNEAIIRGGSLEQQARAAAISALCQLGREHAARAAFERFQRRWPRTPLAARLRDRCATLAAD